MSNEKKDNFIEPKILRHNRNNIREVWFEPDTQDVTSKVLCIRQIKHHENGNVDSKLIRLTEPECLILLSIIATEENFSLMHVKKED